MSESHRELEQVIAYMKAHWPSQVKPEWQVAEAEYPAILQKVLADFTASASQNHQFFRIAGISGSGKTTQILPAIEAHCQNRHYHPILIAARRFVEYHPHYQAIKSYYGDQELRKMTDEFATIMLFLTISKLIGAGYDIILDVTFLDPKMEAILLELLQTNHYQTLFTMIATSSTVTEHFLKDRSWRHTKQTEAEFARATTKALAFYAEKAPDIRIIIWSVYDKPPVYDGPIQNASAIVADYSTRETLPDADDDARRQAKIDYLT